MGADPLHAVSSDLAASFFGFTDALNLLRRVIDTESDPHAHRQVLEDARAFLIAGGWS